MAEYTRYTERAVAKRASRAPLKLLHPRRYVDGKGLPRGKQHGPGPRIPPEQGWTRQAHPVLRGREAGEFFVRADPSLADESVEIDGIMTRPARTGTELTTDDFELEEDPQAGMLTERARTR